MLVVTDGWERAGSKKEQWVLMDGDDVHATRSSVPGVGQPSAAHSEAGSYAHASVQSSSRVCPATAQPALERVRVPGAHAPSPVHSPTASQVHAAVQRDARLPHMPHESEPVVPGMQTPVSPMQVP